MKNLKSNGKVVTMVAPGGGVVAGVAYVIGGTFLIATQTAAAGEKFAAAVGAAEWTLPKHTSDATTAGQIAYWDDSAKLVRAASATGRYIIGTIPEARLAADAYAHVRTNGIHVVAIP